MKGPFLAATVVHALVGLLACTGATPDEFGDRGNGGAGGGDSGGAPGGRSSAAELPGDVGAAGGVGGFARGGAGGEPVVSGGSGGAAGLSGSSGGRGGTAGSGGQPAVSGGGAGGAVDSGNPSDLPDGPRFHQSGKHLVIDVEHHHANETSTFAGYAMPHNWVMKTDRGGYAGSGFMEVTPDERGEDAVGPSSPRGTGGARMRYRLHVTSAATYFVWVRGMSKGAESNGVHVEVDGSFFNSSANNMSGFRPHNGWVWENQRKEGFPSPANVKLAAGDHVLNVWNRDDGFRMDRILLTTDPGYRPTGEGPAESELK